MDEEAFEALWHAHYADILAFCLRRLGDRQEAADATADTFLVAWRRAGEIPGNPRPWLFGVLSETLPGGPIPAGATRYTVFEAPVLVDSPGERPKD